MITAMQHHTSILPNPIECRSGPEVSIAGSTLIALCGCDYLGLSQHPALTDAAVRAAQCEGLTTAGSRSTFGNAAAHERLERRIARFYDHALPGRDAAITLDGLTANMAALEALAATHHIALLDQRSHASQRLAVRAAGMRLERFAHADPADAARAINAIDGPLVVVTDGVFAATGRTAPVAHLLRILPEHSVLLIDDCHGFGVTGRTGRGSVEAAGLDDPRVVVTSTLAKAAGAGGGFVLGPPELIHRVKRDTATFIGTTPVSPALAAAAAAALDLIDEEPGRLAALKRNARRLAAAAARLVPASKNAEVPVVAAPLPDLDAERAEAHFRERGLLVPVVSYPGGPTPRYIRASVSALHTPEQLDRLADAFATLAP